MKKAGLRAGLCLYVLATSVEAAPWSLAGAAGLPDWVDLAVESRFRYETLDSQFRANGRGGDQMLAMRTLARLEAGSERLRAGFEMIDARAVLDDRGTPLDTGLVDAAELLQAYALYRAPDDARILDATSEFRFGRQTLDFGSRRLVSRNRYRNTINAFTGLDWKLTGGSGWTGEALAVVPVVREPGDFASLAADEAVFDEEDFGTVLWLIGWTSAPFTQGALSGARLETYVVGLDESDRHVETRNRRLVTPAARLFRDPARGRLDFQLEVMLQTGTSRVDENPANLSDLDHFAHYEHAQLGYTLAAPWSPRVAALFDHASGDSDPTDRDNDRFDTLFGARRFDYGPTGIWGSFQRANMLSPGVRLEAAPAPVVRLMAGYRAFWLAESRDQWVPARLRDPRGASGRFLGNQFEFSASWAIVPGNLSFEVGGACLLGGGFAERAPNRARDGEDSAYLYSQLSLGF